ncbi:MULTISPECIES: hypothetical protein [Pseudoalteromonas]|uniref:PH domain-containing protein n=3 Tax=Pseudoalteromonas TaxID=53246 RepID=A0A0F4PP29_9GAMM|nr:MULTISPECIES: hypothetical protein [Pseudoalteromonas]KJY97167.1 hypothetical protein TW72_15205 [Pseudoalteromonas ruthenica]KJY99479.1 hypothetical protein TW76_03555 [Pseudoalteromonas ruthenica]MCF2863388.1 hypothetical protein [Pseudoalteromonas sp. CNAT2-18]MCG7558341.1 hypothetical protein [Pseudoalteromonas sp. CNAT2-18.1]MCG7567734.1 hypothetical protein [Pseudoalteromonas sp. CnMc7-15]|tara:strand:+ start:7956 stop:8396 length:441 start_codon:yes stop_codon:yes gene_type:complete
MYQHKQTAWAILIILLWVGGFLGLAFYLMEGDGPMMLFAAILVILAFLFHGLTVRVDEQGVEWFFGPGIAKKRLAFDEIKSVAVVSNSFRHGVGIRITHDGWVYNASGFAAVAIELHDGTFYRVGSNDADNLAKHISAHLPAQEQS